MNINLRQAIIQRVQNKSDAELMEVIEESVGSEERALPGLGVLFEIMWENTDEPTKNSLVATLRENVPQQDAP